MSRPDPWLSVLMPVYNGAATLADSLNSLAGQADGIEVVLVDQASTDDSLSIAEGFSDRLNLRIQSAPQNENWVQNTNLALDRARAPLATMLHQDDVWRPGRAALLQRLHDAAPEAALWVHAADYIDTQGRTVGRFAPPFGRRQILLPSAQALSHLLVQNTVALPAVMFPTQAAKAVAGLDDSLWYTADWDFWLKLARRGPLMWSPEPASGFRLHEGSQTISGSRNLDDFRNQLETPLDRHLSALPSGAARDRARRLARVSNMLNLWLAGTYHGERQALAPLLRQLLGLGPVGWPAFLRDTRILPRVLPRLRLRRGG